MLFNVGRQFTFTPLHVTVLVALTYVICQSSIVSADFIGCTPRTDDPSRTECRWSEIPALERRDFTGSLICVLDDSVVISVCDTGAPFSVSACSCVLYIKPFSGEYDPNYFCNSCTLKSIAATAFTLSSYDCSNVVDGDCAAVIVPTNPPTPFPSVITYYPTFEPTDPPTPLPTFEPTDPPTPIPTDDPTFEPTDPPTPFPVVSPIKAPTLSQGSKPAAPIAASAPVISPISQGNTAPMQSPSTSQAQPETSRSTTSAGISNGRKLAVGISSMMLILMTSVLCA